MQFWGKFNNASARCTDVRLYTLWIKIGTNQRALGEHSHYWTRLWSHCYTVVSYQAPFILSVYYKKSAVCLSGAQCVLAWYATSVPRLGVYIKQRYFARCLDYNERYRLLQWPGIKGQMYLVSVIRLVTHIQNTRVVLPILYCQHNIWVKCQGQIYKNQVVWLEMQISLTVFWGRLFLFDALFTGGQMFWIASMALETKFKVETCQTMRYLTQARIFAIPTHTIDWWLRFWLWCLLVTFACFSFETSYLQIA